MRAEKRELFQAGRYLAIPAGGEKADNLCVFARLQDADAVIVAAPRFFTRLLRDGDALPLGEGVWGDTRFVIPEDLPAGEYRNVFTGETLVPRQGEGGACLRAAHLFTVFPVAMLAKV